MIKFTVKIPGEGTLIGVGITQDNIRALVDGRPLIIKGKDVAVPGVEFMVFFGTSNESMMAELKDHVGPDTEVVDLRTPQGAKNEG